MTRSPGVGGYEHRHGVTRGVPLPLLPGRAGVRGPSVDEQSGEHSRDAQLPGGEERALGARGESWGSWLPERAANPSPRRGHALAAPQASTDAARTRSGHAHVTPLTTLLSGVNVVCV